MRQAAKLSLVFGCCLVLALGGWAAQAEDPPSGPELPAAPETAEPAAPAASTAPPADPFNAADTAWMLVSSALVLMMTAPGLALFYGGLVRKKNVLSILMQCVFLMGLMSVIWALWGYSLAFAPDVAGGLVGGTDYFFLQNVIPTWDASTQSAVVPMEGSIPRSVHMVFQMMFFIITPALICGAFAERMKFSTMVVFSILWGTLVYCPLAHWVWSAKGWLFTGPYAAFDFAGGTVVHISSGFSALVCALLIGRRLGYGQEPMPPHNLTYTCLGSAMLWMGWFGFNAGSALAANRLAANAFVATHLAAAAGTLSWAGAEWLLRGKPSVLGACSGAVAGLVCITPGCGMVTPMAGIVFGLIAGLVCYYACTFKTKMGYDDALDAFGVHGVGGTVGALLTGVFATRAVIPNATTPQGVLEGNIAQFTNQAVGVLTAAVLAVVGSVILLKILDAVMGLRVTQNQELQGLDLNQHGEEGYIFL
jgi:Amt family ammonium transporter